LAWRHRHGDDAEAIHWDGKAWRSVHVEDDTSSEPPRLYGVLSRGPADVWAAGLPEAVFHFDGRS
jgi:hypothetical protein